MNGFNKYFLYEYAFVTSFLYAMILSGIIYTPSVLQAGILPDEVKVYTLQRDKSAEITSPVVQTGHLAEIDIVEQGGVYQIKAVAVIHQLARYVRHVLADYMNIYTLNPSIIESEVLKRHNDGSVSVKTKVIGCAAYFCKELNRVERVRVLPSGDLHSEIIPELSQFKSGQTLWRIKTVGEHSEVTYLSDMEPDIFIPPVVGKFLVKKSIREEIKISFANLEKISSVLAERERQENNPPAQTEFSSNAPCINWEEDSFSEEDQGSW